MKILFYLDAWIEFSKPYYKDPAGEFLFFPIIKSILDSRLSNNKEIFFLFGDAQEDTFKGFCEGLNLNFVVINQKELRQFARNDSEWFKNLYIEKRNETLDLKISEFFKSKLGNFIPDIIFPYSFPVDFFKLIFPDALIIQSESGFTTRAPFVRSVFLDPFGPLKNSYLKKFKRQYSH